MAAACDPDRERCLYLVVGERECDLKDARPICAVCRSFAWRRVAESIGVDGAVRDARAEREQMRTERDAWILRTWAAGDAGARDAE